MKIVISEKIDALVPRFFWGKWLAVLIVIFIIHAATMAVAPYLHSDEFTIVDLGRVILHPETNWALPWLTTKDQPVYVWFYIGPVLQELTFQIVGQYGPRVSGLIGGLAAATALVGWLLSRRTSPTSAFLLGLVFLLDPLFVQSYTMGRVDGWTMAFCISSCWMLRASANKLPDEVNLKTEVLLAGALAAIAVFIWPSAVFLFPLILLELICLSKKFGSANGNQKKKLTPIITFVTCSAVTVVLLLLPIAHHLYTQLQNVLDGLKTNTHFGSADSWQAGIHPLASIITLLQVLKFSPVLPIIALVVAVKNRETGFVLTSLTATILMLFTIVYIHRVQYLLPCFIAIVAGNFSSGSKSDFKSNYSAVLKGAGMAMLIIWSAGLSLFARPILAFANKGERDRDLVYKAAKSIIGSGNYTVFLPAPEFYYAGRSLGWEMYRPYTGVGETISLKALHNILSHVDNAIIPEWELTDEFEKQLKKDGMRDQGDYKIYNVPVEEFNGITTNTIRLRNLYSIFQKPYGPYRLYKR